jgi:hypothetical protein
MYPTADVEKTQAPIPELSEREYRSKGRFDECAGQTARSMTSEEILAELFKYHAPNEVTIPKYAAINQAAKNFAEVILQNCPPSADRSDAIRKIREARMTANAAIALNGLSL